MPLSPEHVVDDLVQRMGRDSKNYGIDWREDNRGGFFATIYGVNLYLREPYLGGVGGGPRVLLTLFQEGKRADITEPQIHISEAPIGKLLRKVTKLFGLPLFPRSPQSIEEKASERLRVGLNVLWNRVGIQSDVRIKFVSREELRDLERELSESRQGEEAAQDLFKKVTGLGD